MLRRAWRRVVASALAGAAGFSTIETSAMVTAVSVGSATAAPHLQQYIDMAHVTKATGDVRVITVSMVRLMTDVGQIRGARGRRPRLLVTEGDVPAVGAAGSEAWTAPVDDDSTQPLGAHLVDNAAGYAAGSAFPPRWRGPYMEGLGADPWGTRYAINIGLLSSPGQAVVVVSAGPNEAIDTPFAQVGLAASGDDIISVLGRGR